MTVGKKGVQADLNVTPMIDILLVLLIIFMVMTPVLMKQHRVDVPKRAEVDVPQEVSTDQLVLTYTKDGFIYLNQTKVERAELSKTLTERFENKRDKTIFLNIDPDANYGEATRIIDITKNAGLDKLAIVTQKPGDKFQVPGAAQK
ncbi:biopolymer transporter ExbD [Myxococcota bacterium]|nr:biopolymer transporter ExbD [Myxococcota bacterium]